MPTSIKDAVLKIGLKVFLGPPILGLWYGYRYSIKGWKKAVHAKYELRNRIRFKTRRLRKSKPLARKPSSSKSPTTNATSTKTSFLHLPTEIRLQIYRIALGDPAIAQINVHSSSWGPRPESWGPGKVIRDDADEPSAMLRLIIGLGGSELEQIVWPPSRGCVRHGAVAHLICGDERLFFPAWVNTEKAVFYSDLMRACRVVYGELLDVLYAENTISLFGYEMAWYFCRNASPEGLQKIRFVHIALFIQASEWDSPSQRKNVQGTIRMLRDSLSGLRQLDIEVVVLWGQPKDPQRFWTWLKMDVLAQLISLEKFVLKVTVYKPFTIPRRTGYKEWMPPCEPLESWDDGEYRVLQNKITSLEETVLS